MRFLPVLSTLLFVVAGKGSPCPKKLSCDKAAHLPHAQNISYIGDRSGSCNPATSLPVIPGNEFSLFGNYLSIFDAHNDKYETSILIRNSHYSTAIIWNVMTAFHPTAKPYSYAEGFGLPFPKGLLLPNTSDARATALGFAFYRFSFGIFGPSIKAEVDQFMSNYGLDANYSGANNFSNPADVGNAIGYAVVAYARADGWNMDGHMEGSVEPMAYSDYTGFVPRNSGYRLADITKWQPLLETNGLGYFQFQTQVTAQLRDQKYLEPFSMDATTFFSTFTTSQPYKRQCDFEHKDLQAYKKQADSVIKTSATLTDKQKMLAEFFDVKTRSFARIPYEIYVGILGASADFLEVASLSPTLAVSYDATLAAFHVKPNIDAVRPVSAIRYLYGNKSITAYAGPYQGTRTFPGKEFNSYLRTMPHADWPSGTACICVAFAEFHESALASLSSPFFYQASFPKGCSYKEPGLTPTTDLTVTWTDAQSFISDCTQSRLWAGVHFQASIDAAKRMCTGIGAAAWDKRNALLAGL